MRRPVRYPAAIMARHTQEERARGRVEVIAGGMFSGKSEELVRRLRRATIARQRVQAFKPMADTRHDPERLVTRDRRSMEVVAVEDSAELERRVDDDVQVVGIDEVQFFDEGVLDVVDRLADRGVRVIAAGLDLDYRRRPFGPVHLLLARAEFVDKMHAVCVRCGGTAHYSQRIVAAEDQVHVGDEESYEARCRECYEPG